MWIERPRRSLAVLAVMLLADCGTGRFDYRPDTEIPDGPGMFSGKEGAFVIYSDRKTGAVATVPPVTARARQPQPLPSVDEFREFQAFQRWRAANRNTPEYREFQEWREWQAFRTWKKHPH